MVAIYIPPSESADLCHLHRQCDAQHGKDTERVKRDAPGHGPAFPASGGAARCQRAASGLLMPDRPGSAAPPCRPPANKAGPAAHSARPTDTQRHAAQRPGQETGCPRCRGSSLAGGNSRAGAPSAPRPMRQGSTPSGNQPRMVMAPIRPSIPRNALPADHAVRSIGHPGALGKADEEHQPTRWGQHAQLAVTKAGQGQPGRAGSGSAPAGPAPAAAGGLPAPAAPGGGGPAAAWRRRRARSSARPTAPKASAPNSAMRSRVVHRPSVPQQLRLGDAGRRPAHAHRCHRARHEAQARPWSGGRQVVRVAVRLQLLRCLGTPRARTPGSGTMKFPSAAVRKNPSVEATIKAKRIILITPIDIFFLFLQTLKQGQRLFPVPCPGWPSPAKRLPPHPGQQSVGGLLVSPRRGPRRRPASLRPPPSVRPPGP